jgi:hypothetical protein
MARAYQHQHLAEAPRGWRVRTKRAADHVLRIAFPPGRRRRGAGRLLEILHPKKNPACENGECAIAQNPVEELLIFGNPEKPGDRMNWLEEITNRLEASYRSKIRVGMDPETAERDAIAESGAGPAAIAAFKKRIANPATKRRKHFAKGTRAEDVYRFAAELERKHPGRKVEVHERSDSSWDVFVVNEPRRNAGEYVKAMADKLEEQYRAKRSEGMGHEEAMTSTIAKAGGADPKILAEFKRRIGNPLSKTYDIWEITPSDQTHRMYHDLPRGEAKQKLAELRKRTEGSGWRYIMKRFQLSGENPSARSRAVKLYKRMQRLTGGESFKVRMQLAKLNKKMGWVMADVAGFARARGINPRRRNQGVEGGELRQAVSLFGTFHGRDPEEIASIQRSAAMRLEYTALGELEYLIVKPPEKPQIEINFEGDDIKLASAPNGRQLYLIDGNQCLDSMLGKFTDDPRKDFIDLGEALEVQYDARKIHTNFEPTSWYHKFGEKNGALPRLMYDKLKKEIFFVGGEYFIDTKDAVSPGIEN